MKKSKFLAAALAATMFATAACGLVACDKDAGVLVPSGDENKPPISQTAECTVTFSGLTGDNATQKTTNGKLASLPTATAPDGKEFKGWATTQGAATVNVTESYTFTGATATVYPVFVDIAASDTEYTITFTGVTDTKTTTGGMLTGTMPILTEEDKEFLGWALTDGAARPDITESNYTSYKFTGDTTDITLYPVYDAGSEEVGDNYCEVGGTKYNLEQTSLPNAETAYTVTVAMEEGDVISFYVDGEQIEAWPGYIWNGLQKSEKASEFTAARAGTFEFNLGYYPANAETGDDATWSVDGDDGAAPMLPDTAVTLKFSDATITLAFDLPGWATTGAYIYVFANNQSVIGDWPGVEMDGGEVTVDKAMGDCQIIISFKQDDAQKQTEDTATTAFSDGGTYMVSIGDWTGDGIFKLKVEEA